MPITAILAIIQAAEPIIANVVIMIKNRKTGSTTVLAVLDSEEAQTQENQAAISAWVSSHSTV